MNHQNITADSRITWPKPRPKPRVVIIGGTAAGTSVAASLARNSQRFDVTLVEASEHIAVATCSLPRFILGEIGDSQQMVHYSARQFADKYGVQVLNGHYAEEIHPHQRQIRLRDLTSDESHLMSYDKLVLCTGAEASKLDVPGADAPNIFRLKNLESGIALRNYLHSHRINHATVVGGGSIGLAMIEVFSRLCAKTTLIEEGTHLLPVCDMEMAKRIEGYLRSQNVSLLTGSKVRRYHLNNQRCTDVELENGELISTDLILEAVGVKPRTELARQAGLRLGSTGAISVDQRFQTSHFNIYAVGDCVELVNAISGKKGYYPKGSLANRGGRLLGELLAGRKFTPLKVVNTTLVHCFDLDIGQAGFSECDAASEGLLPLSVEIAAPSRVRGYAHSSDIHCKLIFNRQGRILGAQVLGRDGVTTRMQAIAIALHEKMDVWSLANMDFAYHPPLAPLWDPLSIAARKAIHRLEHR